MQDSVQFRIKGMNRDLSASIFSPEFAYENKNIRITPVDDNTMFSIVNERGTKKLIIEGIDNFLGIPIGQSTISNKLVIFSAGDKFDNIEFDSEIQDVNIDFDNESVSDISNILGDHIYCINNEDGKLKGRELFSGDLNFNPRSCIETIPFYENENIQKIYMTDGINPPKVINVCKAEGTLEKWNNNSFNLVPKLELNESVNIVKRPVGGNFATGVVQYALTYFNANGQESNIFYTSPLYYLSMNGRGGSPEETSLNSFTITIKNVDRNFDYIRLYSIHRTSIDSTPTVKIVEDRKIDNSIVISDSSYNSLRIPVYLIDNSGNKLPLSVLDETKFCVVDNNGSNYSIYSYMYPKIYSPTSNAYLYNYNKIEVLRSNEDYVSVFGKCAKSEYSTSTITINDTGNCSTIDPTSLLFVGGEDVLFGTMAVKDNKLFIGDIVKNRRELDDELREIVKQLDIEFISGEKSISAPDLNTYYSNKLQLDNSSRQIKTFKYLEWYRFGIQLQYYTGEWSSPIWIKDAQNRVPIQTILEDDSSINLITAQCTISNRDLLLKLLNLGYIKIRPVIVFPDYKDRESICQGILCPTVFNLGDRCSNSPFVQSSWFIRPFAPFDVDTEYSYKLREENFGNDFFYSTGSVVNRSFRTVDYGDSILYPHNKPGDYSNSFGSWAEFRHYHPIPGNNNYSGEIQCLNKPLSAPMFENRDIQVYSKSEMLEWYKEYYYIDQSIVTLHSPDIEFDDVVKSLDLSNYKLRIVGAVPITAFASDNNISTSSGPENVNNSAAGYHPINFILNNTFTSTLPNSMWGWRQQITAPLWKDSGKGEGSSYAGLSTFLTYPWHRNGSLGYTNNDSYGMLDKKKMSNLRYSYKTLFIKEDSIWTPSAGISDAVLFDSNEVTAVNIRNNSKSTYSNNLIYYGNIDKVVVPFKEYKIYDLNLGNAYNATSTAPVRMKYKSTPHVVIGLNDHEVSPGDNKKTVLPDMKNSFGLAMNNASLDFNDFENISSLQYYWENSKYCSHVSDAIALSSIVGYNKNPNPEIGVRYGWLWLGELYNDNVIDRFGGTSDEALKSNKWLVAGDGVSIENSLNPVVLKWEEGDTYFQRYDHIKTYPFTLEDQNSVTEIVSFMCETRINIDGMYNKNRGQINNLVTTPENFNKLNEIYSQQDNYFIYRIPDKNNSDLNTFKNTISWTLTKTAGELIDTWTKLNLASTLDLDGDKGYVRALRRYKDSIIAFQDSGISQILYNDNVQISSTEGVPIEIANSNSVLGKRYLFDDVGCINKWSICKSDNGIYFIDSINNDLYLFDGNLINLTSTLGFTSFMNQNKSLDIWNPVDFNNFVTYYDNDNKEVMIINDKYCLAYSELLKQFTSFYSYDNTPYFSTLKNQGIFTKTTGSGFTLWSKQEGEYNMFFEKYSPFYVTVIANPNPTIDKTFNTIEFRSDSWNESGLVNSTFDTLSVWNEYQNAECKLTTLSSRPSSLKRKFRVWRATIPRDKSNNRDRIRNPWAYIRLSKNDSNKNKTILHDMIVHYSY